MENAWNAAEGDFMLAGIDKNTISAIVSLRPALCLDEEMEKIERSGIKILTFHDPAYPLRLKEIYDYPPVIYIKGSLLSEDEWCLAVVGSRHCTTYGKQVTQEIVTELARNKITVVSG